MNDDKRKQRKMRRFILYQAYSMGMELKRGAIVDNLWLLIGAVAIFIVAGASLIVYNGLKLKKEWQEED